MHIRRIFRWLARAPPSTGTASPLHPTMVTEIVIARHATELIHLHGVHASEKSGVVVIGGEEAVLLHVREGETGHALHHDTW